MDARDALLSLDEAWQALLQAAHPGGDGAPVAGLRLAPSGWQAERPVSTEARELLECLTPLATRPGRLAIAQLGQSLDGRIATESGHSHYVNGPQSLVHLHRLRALMDAVVVGAGTVEADDPQLTVRHASGPQPVRVLLDPRGRVAPGRRVLRDPAAPTLHLHGEGARPAGAAGGHVTRLALPLVDGGFAPAALLEALATRGLRRVLIEGGGVTVSRFLEAGVLHRLHLLMAPLLIGSGRPGLAMTPIATLAEARRPACRSFRCGDDTLFDLDLEAPTA
ncbi:riboflavin-specific deaminase C-terminal domain-containing protein [Halomonas shengliensis]|uniref:Riboflavin-specific deaminase C-terminal domain-containing protein n=2 Tax=Halomonas shengliensis TaxID=419597 RepID=A0A1H0DLX4_9GAMM|nr:RibD family protein [Halomonas shengliensis]SDN70991.1 riboflavin-specific deaminase C-terminal domain-containing protein [Halomonas shengliensis]